MKNLDCANCANKIEAYVRKMDNIKDASMNFSQGVLFVELQDASRSEDTIKAIMAVIPTLEDGVTVEREKSTEEEKPSRMVFLSGKRTAVSGNSAVCGSCCIGSTVLVCLAVSGCLCDGRR